MNTHVPHVRHLDLLPRSSFAVGIAVVVGVGSLASCTGAGVHVGHPTTPVHALTATPTLVGPSGLPAGRSLASPDMTSSGTAHGCSGAGGALVTLTVFPDGMQPNLGCVIVTGRQRLRVVNATNSFGQVGETITLTLRGLPSETIGNGRTLTYPQPPAQLLAPGQHLGTCSCEPDSRFDVWVK
jgi:hypothetical protein